MLSRTWVVRGFAVALLGAAVFAATPLGRDLLFHLLPVRWTGEPERLVASLRLTPGQTVADIGAGSGALVVELARVVGPEGRAYATERTPTQRDAIFTRARSARASVTVLEAPDHATNLPDQCCDAIVMRMVWHHIDDPQRYAVDLRRALRRGGRMAIIDFAPGALPHLADDHGVSPEQVMQAFAAAGLDLQSRDDHWGGRSYLLVFGAR
jgi:ubiquinone/menaquinone biosynthesis C-methylase UbiE